MITYTDIVEAFSTLAEQAKDRLELPYLIDAETEVCYSVMEDIIREFKYLSEAELEDKLKEIMVTFYYLGKMSEKENLFNK
jgi:hypothetical protein